MDKRCCAVIFLLSYLLQTAHCATDFCDSDPRLYITTSTCETLRPHINLILPPIDRNPYHALHDLLWVASHYLSHCTTQYQRKGKITISLHSITVPTQAECAFSKDHFPENSWGSCAAAALAHRFSASLILPYDKSQVRNCYTKTVRFGGFSAALGNGFGRLVPHFRRLSFFGRGCTPADPRNMHSPCDDTESHGVLVPLPERFQSAAFLTIRDSIMAYLGMEPPKWTQENRTLVRVLLYTRGDVVRRRWSNAYELVKLLKMDPRINLFVLNKTPPSFRQQVELYTWADVVIAPHGASMVNSIFLRPGAEVTEVWKHCSENVLYNRLVAHDWTGWHVHLLGVNLQYLQCHIAGGKNRQKDVLPDLQPEEQLTGQHNIDVRETLKVLNTVFERQKNRLEGFQKMARTY